VNKPRICIISHNAYGALCGGSAGHIGGAERQTSLMAKWFAAQGHETSLITWDEGQPDGERVSGVTVWKTCGGEAGLPGLRFFHPRMTSFFSALRGANADIYYHNAAEYFTGLAAAWCRRHDRKFVYSAAAELACDVRLPLLRKPYERILYRYGVKHADLRVVQTAKQQQLLREGWDLSSVVLPMPCLGPSINKYRSPRFQEPFRVAWVGRIDRMKRLEWLLEIAQQLPAIQFDVVAANMHVALQHSHLADYARQLKGRAESLPNVVWHGTVAREEVARIYQQSICLCCTSVHEGFPNIFLEAWSYGIPVVTTFDPDRIVENLRLGHAAGSVNELAARITELVKQKDIWLEYSDRVRGYFQENHQVDAAMTRFQNEFHRLMASLHERDGSIEDAGGVVPYPCIRSEKASRFE
jgi:glycosyltransferase involved in cell wall biosynthesis